MDGGPPALTRCAERYQALFGKVGDPRAGGAVVRWGGWRRREGLAGDDDHAGFRGGSCRCQRDLFSGVSVADKHVLGEYGSRIAGELDHPTLVDPGHIVGGQSGAVFLMPVVGELAQGTGMDVDQPQLAFLLKGHQFCRYEKIAILFSCRRGGIKMAWIGLIGQ